MQRLWSCVLAALGLFTVSTSTVYAENWPQWQGPKRDGIWHETGILEKFPEGGPKVLWRQPIGPGFTGPAVVDGRVYVMDREGEQLPKGKEASKTPLGGKERILCLNAADGSVIWKHEYDCAYTKINYTSGPRTTPTVHEGKVYTLGSMGDLLCLDAAKGTVHWKVNLPQQYNTKPPVWGYSAHLLVVGDNVFTLVGGEGSAIVAFNKDTGKEQWKALTVKEVGYAPPMAFDFGGVRQLIVWHTEALNSLDPKTGKVHWTINFPDKEPQRPGITVSTPRLVGDHLFVSSPHHGSLMVKLASEAPTAELLWRGMSDNLAKPDGLHNLMGSPVFKDGHIYGMCTFGELRCLDAETGKRVWEQRMLPKKSLGATIFIIPQGDRYFLFSETGELIIAKLSPKGYEEIDRAKVIEPTLFSRTRDVNWSHPAFANRRMYVRNDQELICYSMAAEKAG